MLCIENLVVGESLWAWLSTPYPTMLAATTLALSLVLPTSLSRQQLIRSSAAASVATFGRAAWATPGDFTKQGLPSGPGSVSLGSDGISAYEEMKLDKAVKELEEVKGVAPASLQPVLDSFGALNKQVRNREGLKTISAAKLEAASASLTALAASNENLLAQSEEITKLGLQVGVSAGKGDVGKSAKALSGLIDTLVDFGYAFKGNPDERPLAEYRPGLDTNPLNVGK